MAKEEKPKCDSCGTTEPSNNQIITECIQYGADELNSLDIPNALDVALEPDVDTDRQNLKFLTKMYDFI